MFRERLADSERHAVMPLMFLALNVSQSADRIAAGKTLDRDGKKSIQRAKEAYYQSANEIVDGRISGSKRPLPIWFMLDVIYEPKERERLYFHDEEETAAALGALALELEELESGGVDKKLAEDIRDQYHELWSQTYSMLGSPGEVVHR